MAEKTVAMASDASPVRSEETRMRDRYISPAVDIYETAEGLVLMADLPGVTEENLEVRSDHNILTIWGGARPALDGELISREYELVNFFRRFEVGEEIDQSKITAEFKHGVLTLNLPKAAAAKARRIDVKVA